MKKPLKVFEGDYSFWSIQLQLSGQLLISNDDKIKVWNLVSNQLIYKIDIPDQYEYANEKNFGVTSDLKYIVTGGQNGKLKFLKFNMLAEF